MIERGLIVGGVVVPGTDFVLRDPRAWWSWDVVSDRPDLRLRRGQPVQLLTGHWTGGPARSGSSTALAVVRSMRARKRGDGTLADVSCHAVIGWDGTVWQVADLAHATVHAGKAVNLRSIGVECAWPGTARQAQKIARILGRMKSTEPAPVEPVERRVVRGAAVKALAPSPQMLASWVRLAETLATLSTSRPELGLRIPRVVQRTQGRRVPRAGAHEHCDVPGTTKVDAAGYLLDALEGAGWERAA